MNSVTKSFVTKVGSTDADASIINEIQTATKNIIADVDVVGYRVSESKVVSNGTQYRVYVLLEYTDENAQKILLNRLKKDRMLVTKLKANEASKNLRTMLIVLTMQRKTVLTRLLNRKQCKEAMC